jgi:probable rRNA maturation factor
MIEIHIANEQHAIQVMDDRLRLVVRNILDDEGIGHASISIAIVDDCAIQALNHQYLQHDYPTDVLSFVLECDGDRLEGEIIASGETAAASAIMFGWSAQDELLLYVVHGTLHLLGYDDQTDGVREQMRARERHYLAQFALVPRYVEPSLVLGDD